MTTLFRKFETFVRAEDGAVTVDWVVITAAIVALGIVVILAVGAGTESLADNISGHMSSQTIKPHGS